MNRMIKQNRSFKLKKWSLNTNQLDLSVLKDSKSECTPHSDDVPITERCSYTKRLCTASMYFGVVSQSTTLSDEDKASLLVQFNEEAYQSMLEDTNHFIKEHENDISKVQKEWIELYGFPKCTVSECAQTARHYQRGETDTRQKTADTHDDALYAFYQSLYDRLHHYIFHLFEVGMRVDASLLTSTKLHDVAADEQFAAEIQAIQMQQKALAIATERFNTNSNKFTMQLVAAKDGDITLMDAMLEKMNKITRIRNETVRRLKNYFGDNLYDSECIEMDIEDFRDSNICLYPLEQSFAVAETMREFMWTTKRMLHL